MRRLRDRLRGPWRVAVSEASMAPAILPGDWLFLNPLISHWPGRGSIVVFQEPVGDTLQVKRVAALSGDQVPFAKGFLTLAPGEAWLSADADEKATAALGSGPPVDSRRFGPVTEDDLIGRVLFRYGPFRRIGRIPRLRHPEPPREP